MKVTCECGTIMLVKDRRRGESVRCPQCDQLVPVPTVADSHPTSAASPVGALGEASAAPLQAAAWTAESSPSLKPTLVTPALASPEQPAAPPLPTELPGMEPSVEGRRSSLHLAIAVAVVGLFSAIPAFVYLAQHSPIATLLAMALPRWAAFLLLMCGIHLAYAVYLAQLPDWSSVWVVAIAMLATATLDSILLAATLLGSSNSSVVRMLELHDYLRGGRAAGWCFIMLCLSITVAYAAGRTAARWHSTEDARLQALHIND